MLPAARTLPFLLESGDLELVTGLIILRGWSLRNLSDSDSTSLQLFDGTGTSGTAITWVDLLPAESTREWFSGDGIGVMSGLFATMTAEGGVSGTIYYSPGTLIDGLAFVDGALGAWTGNV